MGTDLIGCKVARPCAAHVQQPQSGAARNRGAARSARCRRESDGAGRTRKFSVEEGSPCSAKGMSAANVKKAHDALVTAFNDPTVKETMAKQGNTINISSTEHAQSAFRNEMAKYAALVKKVGLEPQ